MFTANDPACVTVSPSTTLGTCDARRMPLKVTRATSGRENILAKDASGLLASRRRNIHGGIPQIMRGGTAKTNSTYCSVWTLSK